MHEHARDLVEWRGLRAQLDRDSRRVRQRRCLQSRRVDPQLDLQPLADPTQALQAAQGQRCRSNSGTRIRRRSRRRRQVSRRAFRRRNALQESASEASSSPARPPRRPLNLADLVTGKRLGSFDRHTRAGQENRSGEFEDARGTRSKKIAVDAMRPAHQTQQTRAFRAHAPVSHSSPSCQSQHCGTDEAVHRQICSAPLVAQQDTRGSAGKQVVKERPALRQANHAHSPSGPSVAIWIKSGLRSSMRRRTAPGRVTATRTCG